MKLMSFLFSIFIQSILLLPKSYSQLETSDKTTAYQRKSINHKHRANFSELNSLYSIDSSFINSTMNMTTSVRISSSFSYHSQIHSKTDFLFIITVQIEQITMFSYWLRWAKIAGLSKFLVFAMDNESATKAQSYQLHTYNPFESNRLISYSEKIAYRHEFFLSLIEAGVNFISVSANTFVLDLTSLSLPERDIYLYPRATPPKNVNERTKVNGDVFGLSVTRGNKAVEFLRRVGHCFKHANMSLTVAKRRFVWPSPTQIVALHYQSCMEKGLFDMRREVKRTQPFHFFNIDEVANSKLTFKLNIPQSKGDLPAMLLIDEPIEEASRIELARVWNLNLKPGENDHPKVKHAPYVSHNSIEKELTATAAPTAKRIVLTIRIITMDRPSSLERLLASLSEAYYDGNVVHIEFFVDKPNPTVDHTKYNAVVELVKAFKWKHGNVHKNFERKNAGIFKMWVRHFPVNESSTEEHCFMVLEDDVEVSPFFYLWTKRVLMTYGPHAEGNLYGFTIQRSHSIIGVKKGEKWTETFHDRTVSRSSLFYRYQLLSTWGQVFFPRHWNAFVDWAVVAKNQIGFHPCVPYLVGNEWYWKAAKKIWSIWFNYFVYHSGLTNLYINYNQLDKSVNYALLINHRENGLHYFSKSKEKAVVPVTVTVPVPVTVIEPEVANNRQRRLSEVFISESLKAMLPPMSEIPLYNFFFNIVENENLLKHQWRFTSNYRDKCITNTNK